MSAPYPHILNWLGKRRTDLTSEGLITRIELWHTVDGEAGNKLETIHLEDRDEDEDPDDLTIELWNAAEDDAGTHATGSAQRYTLLLYRGDERQAEESKSFILHGNIVSTIGGSTELPNERGMISQDIRQRNDMHGLVVRMAEGTAVGLARQLENERNYTAKLQESTRNLMSLEQNLLDRSFDREQERDRAKKSEERIDQLIGVVMSLGPILLSKWLGGPPALPGASPGGLPPFSPPPPPAAPSGGSGPNTTGGANDTGAPPPPAAPTVPIPVAALPPHVAAVMARDVAIGNVLGSLESPQLQTIATTLRPDQALAFMEIYSAFSAEHQARASAVPSPVPPAASRRPKTPVEETAHGNEETHH